MDLTSRKLVTIGPDNPCWDATISFTDTTFAVGGDIIGDTHLVRIQPPHSATDAQIRWVKQLLIQQGCVGLKPEPRAAAPGVLNRVDDGTPVFRVEVVKVPGIRDTVHRMMDNAFTQDRSLLAECLAEALAEAESCTS